jgi:hypothetical protein
MAKSCELKGWELANSLIVFYRMVFIFECVYAYQYIDKHPNIPQLFHILDLVWDRGVILNEEKIMISLAFL